MAERTEKRERPAASRGRLCRQYLQRMLQIPETQKSTTSGVLYHMIGEEEIFSKLIISI